MPADREVDEVVEAVEVAAEKAGRTFSLKAVLALLATTAGVSGFGGAATVAAQDAVQDERIAANSRQIAELRGQVFAIADATTRGTANVENLKDDVKDIKAATEEIRRLLMQERRNGN